MGDLRDEPSDDGKPLYAYVLHYYTLDMVRD